MNTELETLPELRDAMTAEELKSHAAALARALGARAEVYISAKYLSLYPLGFSAHGDDQYFHNLSWPDAIRAAWVWVDTKPKIARAARVRAMALTIIDQKDQHGAVTAIALIRCGFARAEVKEMHADACAVAGELCQGAPFVVEGV
jgi:hypothetical protein